MDANEIIGKLQSSFNELLQVMQAQERTIADLQARVTDLEHRLENTSQLLQQERNSHSNTRDALYGQIDGLKAELSQARESVTSATKERDHLRDIVLNIGASIDHIVNPPKPAEAPPSPTQPAQEVAGSSAQSSPSQSSGSWPSEGHSS